MADAPGMSSDQLDNFQLADPEFLKCPYPFYSAMRSEGPVFHSEATPYLVATDSAVRDVLTNPASFSSVIGTPSVPPPEHLLEEVTAIRESGWERSASLILGDDPNHTQERRVIAPFLSPRQTAALRPAMAEILDDLLDAVRDKDEIEFTTDISIPFSVKVICLVLNLPQDDWPRILAFTDADSAAYGTQLDDEERLRVERLVVEMQHYYVDRVHQLRQEPATRDVMSAVAHAEIADPAAPSGKRPLSDMEMAEICRQLQTGGNETTRKYFCDLMVHLAENPEVWDRYREDKSYGVKIIEESLRLSTQLQSAMRVVPEDGVELESCPIPKGSLVMPLLGSANRDPQRFPDPDSFNPERENVSDHLTFSLGAHTCPGNHIARAEADVLLNKLAERWSSFTVANLDDLEYEPSFLIRSLKSVRVRPVWQ